MNSIILDSRDSDKGKQSKSGGEGEADYTRRCVECNIWNKFSIAWFRSNEMVA